MKVSDNAFAVLESRYLLKNKKGEVIETPSQMAERVAGFVAKAEKKNYKHWVERFTEVIDSLEFLPNTPTLINAGRKDAQLSACFVLPIYDNIGSIFNTLKQMAFIHKSGGGTGFNFSALRPANSLVNTTFGVASGPVSFMKIYDVATDVIKQGGVRRGANLGLLYAWHPDIVEWIGCKKNTDIFQNFNISVAVDDEFFNDVREKKDYELKHTRLDGKMTANAGEVFEQICQSIWETGEPGIIFLDEINRKNPTPWLGEIKCTNPCGEQPLLYYESCNLGSINITKFLKGKKIDYDRLDYVVRIAIAFLDDVIDVNTFPTEKIKKVTKQTRKIGLGIMGWADLLMDMKVSYDSDKAIMLAEKVMGFISDTAADESHKLGMLRGFYPASKNSKEKYRNATRTTIAPTGTLSTIADCSSGIEPLFSLEYDRFMLDNKMFRYKSKHAGIKADWVKTALNINPEWHIKMQAAFQRYVDNAVSKTINLPKNATVNDVKKVILLANELKCKGLTMYRQGTRDAPMKELSECSEDKCLI